MLYIDNKRIDLMDKINDFFIPEDYDFNFYYSKKEYPLFGFDNITLILIIKEMINLKKTKKEIENAKMTLLISNLKLINWTIRNYFDDSNLDKEELQMIGLEGLYYAIEKFNYNYVVGFSRFAIIAIRNSIRHNFRQVSDIPIYAYFERLDMLEKKELLTQKYGREVSLQELAQSENIDIKRLEKVLSKLFIRTEYIEENHTNINDEVYSILRMQNRYDITTLILSVIPEKKKDIYLNIINYYPNSLNRLELCDKYNLAIQTIALHYNEVKNNIKKYKLNKDKYITGNNQLYRILIELIRMYRIEYEFEDFNNLIRRYYCNIGDVDLLIKVFNKLIDICNKHINRDSNFIAYELFKEYDMLLEKEFVEEFFNIYKNIANKYKEKRRRKK